jgi:hypothetical protein
MIEDGWSERKAQEYEKLDELWQLGIEATQKTCRKLYTEGVDWSPQVTLLRYRVLFWKLACKRAHLARVQRRHHTRVKTKAKLQGIHAPAVVIDIIKQLKQLKLALKNGASTQGRRFWKRRRSQ